MSNVKYPQLCHNLIRSLIDQGELNANIEYMASKGIVKKAAIHGNYSVVHYGTAKECYSFLEGIQYVAFANLPTNKNID